MSLIYPNHIQLLKPRRLIRTQKPQISELQSSVWGLDFTDANQFVRLNTNASVRAQTQISLVVRGIKFSSLAGLPSLFSEAIGSSTIIYLFALANGTIRWAGRAPSNSSFTTWVTSSNQVNTTDFFDIVAVCDTVTDLHTLVVNDTVTQNTVEETTFSDIAANTITIGKLRETAQPMKGIIGEVIRYNRALTIPEAREFTESPQKLPDKRGLVGWWRLQEGFGFANGTIIRDWSGQENHGTMQSFPSNPWVNIGVR